MTAWFADLSIRSRFVLPIAALEKSAEHHPDGCLHINMPHMNEFDRIAYIGAKHREPSGPKLVSLAKELLA